MSEFPSFKKSADLQNLSKVVDGSIADRGRKGVYQSAVSMAVAS